jgi:hypothetical protein
VRRAGERDIRLLITAAWIAVVVATQAWPSWETGIRQLFASDVASYERIAAAAPGLPSSSLATQHAQRFPAHWVTGTVASVTDANLHDVYRVASVLCLLAVVLVMYRVFANMVLGACAFAISMGLVVASVYSMRYLLAAPGMLSDAVFLLGFALLLLAFVDHSTGQAVVGVAVATLGRQTAVPLGVVAAIAILFVWEQRRRSSAILVLSTCLGIFVTEWLVARSFSTPGSAGVETSTLLGSLGHPVRLLVKGGIVRGDARAVLGVLVPLGVIAGAWLRGKRPEPVPSLLTAAVLVQPLLLSPDWVANNQPRLAALALPGLAVVAAGQLRDLPLATTTLWVVLTAIFVASFHPRYSDVGTPNTTVWGAIDVVASVSIALALGRSRQAPATSRSREQLINGSRELPGLDSNQQPSG